MLLFFLIINPLFFIIYLGSIFLLLFVQNSPELIAFCSQQAIQVSMNPDKDSTILIQFIKVALKFLMTLFTFDSILSIIWFIACLKLRNVNKKMKTQTSTAISSDPT